MTRVLGIRAIGEKSQYALVAVRGQRVQVEELSVHRRCISLEIAGMDDRPCRSLDGQGAGIDDRMRDVKKLDAEATDLDPLFRRDGVKLRLFQQSVLLEFVLHKSHRERRAV